MNTLWILLLHALLVQAEVTPQKDFDLERMEGKWYLIGFATNAQWFINRKAEMKMGTAILTPTADGDLEMTYNSLNSDGSCWRMTHLAKKTDIPGKFTFRSQRWASENDMRIVEVKYDEYTLVHVNKTKGGVSTVLNKLYGRTKDLSQEKLHKFKHFSIQTGIQPENIKFLPKNEECTSA